VRGVHVAGHLLVDDLAQPLGHVGDGRPVFGGVVVLDGDVDAGDVGAQAVDEAQTERLAGLADEVGELGGVGEVDADFVADLADGGDGVGHGGLLRVQAARLAASSWTRVVMGQSTG
jgi:hypothetical protein